MIIIRKLVLIVLILLFSSSLLANPIVIAHRGASGYLPEHTIAAKSMAYAMGVDFIEQDVVLTKDNVPIVIHDTHLDTISDVANQYPDRARDDGRFYAIDFKLEEIKKLNVTERINLKTKSAVFPQRFPISKSSFRISTLAEEIELIQGLNQSMGKNVGLYTEIKAPAWHLKEGRDISKITLDVLAKYGYKEKEHDVFVQCFDAAELKRIKTELNCKMKLVLLVEPKTQVDLKEVAKYADGIGPSLSRILSISTDGKIENTSFVADAHKEGLIVHPWTFRKDELPKGVNVWTFMNSLFNVAKIDGIFSDFPDITAKFLKERNDLE